jgi:hypothetical protein
MRENYKTLTPAKAGNIHGKFVPSPTKQVVIEETIDKVTVRKKTTLNRKERRHGDYKVIR